VINLIGDIITPNGYGNHTKGLANALDKIEPIKLTSQINPGAEKLLNDRELEMLKRKGGDINLIVTHPLFWRLNLGKRNWAYCVWEGDKVPDYMIEEMLNPQIEKIIVPSKHTYDAVAKCVIMDNSILSKLIIVPHGVDLNLFYPKEKPSKVTFLCNKGWRNNEDRGGIQYAIKAYFEEFTDKDDVELIIKVNPVYGVPDITKLITELTDKKSGVPKLTFSFDLVPQNKLVEFYNKGNVFLSPTRAEAFNIPCLEAMACGLPVLTTNFGGQTDFVNDENGWLIGGQMTEIKHELEYEGISWLTPSIIELRKVMREIYSNPQLIKQKGLKAIKTAQEFTWDNSAKKICQLL
jgi:glycosyltransferase involved in cell wall biosynthesis